MAPSSTDRSDRQRGIIPLYSTPRRLHQQQHLAWLQSSESRGEAAVRSAGLPSLASSPTRSFAAAEDQQAVERRGSREASLTPPPHPPRLFPPPARRAARIRRPRSAAASPGARQSSRPIRIPPCSGRAFPRRSTWAAVDAGAVSRGRHRGRAWGLWSAAPSVAVAGFRLRPAVLLISVGGFEVRCFSSRSISMELGRFY
jgi:hypothetical protein